MLLAGDIAVFQNLGFSPDSRYFMFGQYGISEKTSFPYAELYTVEVAANKFVPAGAQKAAFDRAVQPGNDGRGALYILLERSVARTRHYRIDHLATGRLVYILLDGEQPKEELEFRDFQAGKRYRVRLNQSAAGSGSSVKAAFHIVVTVQSGSGPSRSFTLGLPEYYRQGVRSYRIKQIVLAPDSRSLVFVVAKEEVNGSGADIRYMVETLLVPPPDP